MGILSTRARSRTPWRALVIVAVLAVGLVLAGIALATPNEIDLTTADSSGTANDGWFYQGEAGAGTGNLNPFVRITAKGNERGYNTGGIVEYDTKDGNQWTKPLLLSAVPAVEGPGGLLYREIVLDINEIANPTNKYISLDELKLFVDNQLDLTLYNEGTELFGNDDDGVKDKAWDMDLGAEGDSVVLMDYKLESGSGALDVTVLVPDSVFDPYPNCEYGNTSCASYLFVWSVFGTESDNTDEVWTSDADFEEWATVIRPVVHVEKTVVPAYTQTRDWELIKDYDDDYSMFAGDDVDHEYLVTLNESLTPGDFSITGTITISNPTGDAAFISNSENAVITAIDDYLDIPGSSVVVSCPEAYPITLSGQETIVCTYVASGLEALTGVESGVNTVDVTIEDGEGEGGTITFSATAPYDFGAVDPTIIGEPENPTIIDDNGTPGDEGDDFSVTDGVSYWKNFACSDDAAMYAGDGHYSYTVVNTATAYDGETALTSDIATVNVDCYAPVVSKTAQGNYDLNHTWTIDKEYDGNYAMFAGESTLHGYEITLDETETEENRAVTGAISVANPAGSPGNMVVALADVLDDATVALISGCTGGTWDGSAVTVAPGATASCSYEANPSDRSATENTVTATFNEIDFVDSESFTWAKTDTGYTAVNVSDDYGTAGDSDDDLGWGPFSGDDTILYNRTFACSNDPAMYEGDGHYSYSVINVAEIDETGASDDATVNVDCYAPVVSKTAVGAYDERHEWDITKGPNGEYWKFAGETASHDYTIDLTETVIDENFAVTGIITIQNPHPTDAMTVTLSDQLDDGTIASLLCDDDDAAAGHQVTVAANSSDTCSYSATPGTTTATSNTATAAFAGADYTATQGFSWAKTLTGEADVVNVTDHADDGSTDRTFGPFSSSDSDEYQGSWMCSRDPADYTDGHYMFTVNNTATIDETGDNDSATVTVHCYAPVVAKTAVPEFTRTYHWAIDKEAFLADGGVVPVEGLNLEAGQSYDLEWKIEVTNTGHTDSDWGVTGVITVDNPNPMDAMTVTLSDELDDATVASITGCSGGTLTVDSLEIPAGGTATCDYEADDAGGDATSNTVTATLNGIDFTGTETFSYVTPTTEVQATIDVTDVFMGGAEVPLGSVHYSESPKTFTFYTLLSSDPAHNPDVLLICEDNLVVNQADIWTSDDEARVNLGYDVREVPVNVHCFDGCSLTQGYWKTHNDSFWGGAPADATWFELVYWALDAAGDWQEYAATTLGEDAPFFLSGDTYFNVMWTPSKGNAYYNLARQYIAAQLNFLNDADPSAVSTEFAAATELFKTYTPEYVADKKGKPGKDLRKQFVNLANILTQYNEGDIGPGHCDEDYTSQN